MSELIQHPDSIEWRFERQILRIEPWGENSLRVRATCAPQFSDNLLALLAPQACEPVVTAQAEQLTLRNGNITAVLNLKGQLAFYNQRGELLLEEMWRQRSTVGIGASEKSQDKYISALKLDGREFKPLPGGKYQLTVRFESRADERIYGMGQYQQPWLDLKGCVLELAQRNSQASVPFMQSSLGYGLLWNNPAIGEASFAKNQTEWQAKVTQEMDYWITAADSIQDITRQYAKATGTPPPAPGFTSGLWQCKLRYRTQQEVLEVARDVDAIILCTGYKHHFPFLPDELRLKTSNRLWPLNLYEGVAFTPNPKLFYLGMQDLWYSFNMFDAQAWLTRDIIMDRIQLPSRADMEAANDHWREKEVEIRTDAEAFEYQGEYIKRLIAQTDYPDLDIDNINRIFLQWKKDKKADIMGYRDKCYRSVLTGTLAARHHVPWMKAFDDSLEAYLRLPSTRSQAARA